MGATFQVEKLGKKFFDDAYFRGAVFSLGFPVYVFVKIHFIFCCVNTIGFLQDFWNEKIEEKIF